ncbi:MAG TPA: helix-turn-helix domain-containing protein [Jatrophihabitans sp.]|jgi:excisionase family DNA binding protein
MPDDDVNLVLAGGAAELLEVSRPTVYRYIREGLLRPAGKNQYGQLLFDVADVNEAKKAAHARRFSIAEPA